MQKGQPRPNPCAQSDPLADWREIMQAEARGIAWVGLECGAMMGNGDFQIAPKTCQRWQQVFGDAGRAEGARSMQEATNWNLQLSGLCCRSEIPSRNAPDCTR